MRPAEDLVHVSTDLFLWSEYDPAVKADLYSTGLLTPAGLVLIDPIPLPSPVLRQLRSERIAAVIVTNENHERAARSFAHELSAPLFAHPEALPGATPLTSHDNPIAALSVIEIAGAPAGEIALHSPAQSGTLIIGDALIQMEPMGFALLPAKYCRNQKEMKRSLAALLEYSFERILFAHGPPLIGRARAKLAALLQGIAETP